MQDHPGGDMEFRESGIELKAMFSIESRTKIVIKGEQAGVVGWDVIFPQQAQGRLQPVKAD
jgi:hypothetical protein